MMFISTMSSRSRTLISYLLFSDTFCRIVFRSLSRMLSGRSGSQLASSQVGKYVTKQLQR
jgi:hypothetical protein